MRIAIVTTCMGRIEHLKQSLPRFSRQDGVDHDVYVVDWSSPDGLEPWFRSLDLPNGRLVSVPGKRYFHLSAARNAGGRAACRNGADLLAFIDADILIPPDFLYQNLLLAQQAFSARGCNFFLQTKKLLREGVDDFCVWGSCMAPRQIWEPYQYNENIATYGHEDNELYSLWVENGVTHLPMYVEGVSGLIHGDEDRMRFYAEEIGEMRNIRENNKRHYRGKRTDLF